MISPARSFLLRVGGVEGFSRLSLAEQIEQMRRAGALVAITGYMHIPRRWVRARMPAGGYRLIDIGPNIDARQRREDDTAADRFLNAFLSAYLEGAEVEDEIIPGDIERVEIIPA